MKKLITLTVALVATLGISYAANTFRDVKEQSKCQNGFKCTYCKGTGFNGNINCSHCKGTGRTISY